MGRASDAKQRLIDAGIELIRSLSYGAVSVDTICGKAGVRKGSFYHFFPSKSDLVIACMEAHWGTMRPHLDRIFSPTVAPMDRIVAYCRGSYEVMLRQKEGCGRVLGCPFCSVGSELSALDERIRSKAAEVLDRGVLYVESAIAEAQREGSIEGGDPRALARGVYAFLSGLILQARIYNDPELLRHTPEQVFRLLGVQTSVPA